MSRVWEFMYKRCEGRKNGGKTKERKNKRRKKNWKRKTNENKYRCVIVEILHGNYCSSTSSLNRYVDQYETLNRANTSGKTIREITSIRLERVGNFEIQERKHKQLLLCCICTSQCLIISTWPPRFINGFWNWNRFQNVIMRNIHK